MSGTLTYRIFRDEDLPQMLRLWREESGWGEISEGQWRSWHLDGPHGPCIVAVAVDDRGEIGGQTVFAPAEVYAGGRVVRALRVSAPVLRKDLRQPSLGLNHPFAGLYKAGEQEALRQGFGLLYGLPDHAWIPFFRWVARITDWLPKVAGAAGINRKWLPRIAEHQCFEVATGTARAANGYVSRPAEGFGEEYEALWREACDSLPIACGVVRHPAWLNFRNGGHVTLEVRDSHDDTLAGYVAVKKTDGLILDFLARRRGEVEPVLGAALGWFAEGGGGGPRGHEFKTLKAMGTPSLRPALDALGFRPVEYKFAFICDSLDPTLSPAIEPSRWYIMPGD